MQTIGKGRRKEEKSAFPNKAMCRLQKINSQVKQSFQEKTEKQGWGAGGKESIITPSLHTL